MAISGALPLERPLVPPAVLGFNHEPRDPRSVIIIIIIFIRIRGIIVITYKQANKINTCTNTKSAVIEKSMCMIMEFRPNRPHNAAIYIPNFIKFDQSL